MQTSGCVRREEIRIKRRRGLLVAPALHVALHVAAVCEGASVTGRPTEFSAGPPALNISQNKMSIYNSNKE